ncbi:glycosyltransferase family 2 protein [Nonomuraea gerenzanensis]|uniref:hypothetical protein n=1 Tax=Nonomuraea gerenzanensis TaxID=93944 RepID=UPI001CD9F237|nr:hypothetical protein [Nonomuraea gerenzanensis]UBU14036.1 hypothetical protein LCN96_03100 [Nonomuraea gerenzanensis]
MTDARPPAQLRPARLEGVAGGTGTGRDTAGGGGRAPGVGTAGTPKPKGAAARPEGEHARMNPAAELGFSGDPGQHGDPGDQMLHAQRVWDGTLATNRLDELGVNSERQRVETKDVTVGVGLLVDGWPGDVRRCLQSVIDHTQARVLALDLGNVDGAGDVLRDLAERYPERITAWHVAEQPHWRGGTATWGEGRAKLLRLDESEVHVLMDTDVALAGDALTPLVAAVVEGAVAAGWQGLEPSDGATEQTSIGIMPQWREGPGGTGPEWRQAGPGKVRALTGGLVAVRRAQAINALPEDACYGAYADLELSLALRGDLVVPDEPPPVEPLGRHEVPSGYLDRESRRNYDGVLRMLSAS